MNRWVLWILEGGLRSGLLASSSPVSWKVATLSAAAFAFSFAADQAAAQSVVNSLTVVHRIFADRPCSDNVRMAHRIFAR